MESKDYTNNFLGKIVGFSCLMKPDYFDKEGKPTVKESDAFSFWMRLIFWCPIFYVVILPFYFVLYLFDVFGLLIFGFMPKRFTHYVNGYSKAKTKRILGVIGMKGVYPYQPLVVLLFLLWRVESPETMYIVTDVLYSLDWAIILELVFFFSMVAILIFVILFFKNTALFLTLKSDRKYYGKNSKKIKY